MLCSGDRSRVRVRMCKVRFALSAVVCTCSVKPVVIINENYQNIPKSTENLPKTQ